MTYYSKKKSRKEISFLLQRFFTQNEKGKSEDIMFSDYFLARKFAKKIIQDSAKTKEKNAIVSLSQIAHYKEIAPDHWVSDDETITISTVKFKNN